MPFGERLHAGDELARRRLVEAARQCERDVRLAGLGSHRGQIGERGRQRLVSDVGRCVRVEPEMRPLADRVDRGDGDGAGAHDGRVVAGAAQEPLAARLEQLLE